MSASSISSDRGVTLRYLLGLRQSLCVGHHGTQGAFVVVDHRDKHVFQRFKTGENYLVPIRHPAFRILSGVQCVYGPRFPRFRKCKLHYETLVALCYL